MNAYREDRARTERAERLRRLAAKLAKVDDRRLARVLAGTVGWGLAVVLAVGAAVTGVALGSAMALRATLGIGVAAIALLCGALMARPLRARSFADHVARMEDAERGAIGPFVAEWIGEVRALGARSVRGLSAAITLLVALGSVAAIPGAHFLLGHAVATTWLPLTLFLRNRDGAAFEKRAGAVDEYWLVVFGGVVATLITTPIALFFAREQPVMVWFVVCPWAVLTLTHVAAKTLLDVEGRVLDALAEEGGALAESDPEPPAIVAPPKPFAFGEVESLPPGPRLRR